MSSDRRRGGLQPAGEGRRRSGRFPVLVPIEVRWREAGGAAIKADAQAKEVNLHGGLLEFLDTETYPPVGTQIELINLFSGDGAQARATDIRRSKEGRLIGVAIELLAPSETFWGLTFRLRRITAELLNLEESIKSGDIDPRVLREFRDAVDYVRKTAWAVQEWQERQLQHRNTATVLPLLTAERIRRTTQLCAAVCEDLKAVETTPETAGLEALFQATLQLYLNLARMFGQEQDS